MFWRRKVALPITTEDQEWVDESLNWLRMELGEEHFNSLSTILPTDEFYPWKFTGTIKDAEFVLERTMELMQITDVNIQLDLFNNSPIVGSDGYILTTPGDKKGNWDSASGMYQQIENGILISIEQSQLNYPESLIATISHELSHCILLGENRLEINDEYLTDLTAVVYGFGIFIGNSRFKFSSSDIGWQTSNQGYLPEQVIAYAMACLQQTRKEEDFTAFLNKSMKNHYNRCLKYVATNK